ncbi:MAG: sulfide:quinone oxidoreductase [Cyclobacteriaceae bacterium]|jgi:sulfide:quinone oxidoreductase
MSTVVVLGAGVSVHTATQTLKKNLGKGHKVVVISPNGK